MTDAAPFSFLSFSLAKPGWGSSSLTVSPDACGSYELRVKRIEGGVSTVDEARSFKSDQAASLKKWIETLGFFEESVSSAKLEGAGFWELALRGASKEGGDVLRGGTDLPDSFPDLLSTMTGLGLPGFTHLSEQAFLADFCTRRPRKDGAPLPAAPMAAGAPGLEQALAELARNPQKAEAALREQVSRLPVSKRQELLAYVKQADPDNYEWWKRLLLG